jgi:hypothetical protein
MAVPEESLHFAEGSMAKRIYVDVNVRSMKVAPQAQRYDAGVSKAMSEAAARALEGDSKRRFATKGKSAQGFRLEFTLKSVTKVSGGSTLRCQFQGMVHRLPHTKIQPITKASGSGDAVGGAAVADVADAALSIRMR